MSDQAQTAGQDNTATPAQDGTQATTATTLLTGAAGGTADANKPDAQAAKPGEADATKANETPADDADKAKEVEGDKDKAAQGAPDKYELKAPEGFEQLDSKLVETFEPLARELNLSNDKANKLVETMMPKVVERITEQHREAWGKQLETWVSDVKADKEIGGEALGGNLQAAQRAITKYGTPELKSMFDYPSAENPKGLGLGNHPELVRFISRIGKAMGDDALITGNGSAAGEKKSAAQVLFGDT